MKRLRIPFLFLSVAAIFSCSSEYKSLRAISVDQACLEKFLPVRLATSWYAATIDVAGKHFSGLLLIKNMPDSSKRIVFTSEAGVSFFDFEFDSRDLFKVRSIIAKMDSKPVISVLRKDFELLLGINFKRQNLQGWASAGHHYFGAVHKKETSYLVTDDQCADIAWLELGSKRKKKVMIAFDNNNYPLPDGIRITHFLFPMSIQLTRFEKE